VGSGTGSTLLPLKEKYQSKMNIYACDFSPSAIELLKEQKICELAFVKNVELDPIPEIEPQSLDLITMIFFLSAIHPDAQDKVI